MAKGAKGAALTHELSSIARTFFDRTPNAPTLSGGLTFRSMTLTKHIDKLLHVGNTLFRLFVIWYSKQIDTPLLLIFSIFIYLFTAAGLWVLRLPLCTHRWFMTIIIYRN